MNCDEADAPLLSCLPQRVSDGGQHPASASHVVDVGLGGVVVCLDQKNLVLELRCRRLQGEVDSRQLPPVGAVPRLTLAEEASGLIGWSGTPAHWLPPAPLPRWDASVVMMN